MSQVNQKTSARTLDPIPLFELQPIDTAEPVKGKLELQVRVTPLEEEFKGVPKTTVEIHRQILLCRQRQLEATYQGTLAYLKALKEDPRFFRKFGCDTIDAYHIKYGLGSGDKLGNLIALVKLFEPRTFMIVGSKLLNQMILLIVSRQASKSARKRDYQRIFDRYCDRYPQFDREAFRDVVNEYLAEQYPPPKAVGVSTGPKPPAPVTPISPLRGVLLKPETRRIDSFVVNGPEESIGHRLVEDRCSGCERRDIRINEYETLVESYERYSQELLKIIRGKLRLSELKVPEEVQVYRKLHGLPKQP